jgi:hypothetical protein
MWYLFTDVSGQRIGPIFKGQESFFLLGLLTLEDGTDVFPNVGNQLPHDAA